MARMARVVVPNCPHHVTQRGDRRQKTFFCDDDYRHYIALISKYAKKEKNRGLGVLFDAKSCSFSASADNGRRFKESSG
jgi:hypothetical protein